MGDPYQLERLARNLVGGVLHRGAQATRYFLRSTDVPGVQQARDTVANGLDGAGLPLITPLVYPGAPGPVSVTPGQSPVPGTVLPVNGQCPPGWSLQAFSIPGPYLLPVTVYVCAPVQGGGGYV